MTIKHQSYGIVPGHEDGNVLGPIEFKFYPMKIKTSNDVE